MVIVIQIVCDIVRIMKTKWDSEEFKAVQRNSQDMNQYLVAIILYLPSHDKNVTPYEPRSFIV